MSFSSFNDKCVCEEITENPIHVMRCGHAMHVSCALLSQQHKNTTCPWCREPIKFMSPPIQKQYQPPSNNIQPPSNNIQPPSNNIQPPSNNIQPPVINNHIVLNSVPMYGITNFGSLTEYPYYLTTYNIFIGSHYPPNSNE